MENVYEISRERAENKQNDLLSLTMLGNTYTSVAETPGKLRVRKLKHVICRDIVHGILDCRQPNLLRRLRAT
jgi:hypothetical protein